jgi:hypothetical protein
MENEILIENATGEMVENVVSDVVTDFRLPVENLREFFSGDFIAWNDVWLVGGLIFFFFWIVILIWVIKDVNARSQSFGFQLLAVVFILFLTPLFGLPLYLACRPQGWKRDKTPWRQVALGTLQECKNCHTLNSVEHTCCIACGDVLKVECRECGEWYVRTYGYCPFCGAPNIDGE